MECFMYYWTFVRGIHKSSLTKGLSKNPKYFINAYHDKYTQSEYQGLKPIRAFKPH